MIPHTKREDGFTLVELIYALLISATLLAIAVPKALEIRERWILDTTSKEIVEDLRWAQNMAVSECTGYNFDLNIVDKFYRVKSITIGSPTIKHREISPAIEIIGCTFKESGAYRTITFSSTGIPSQTGTIHLKTKNGKEARITVAVGTGRVALYHDG